MPFKENIVPQEIQLDISTLHDRIWSVIDSYCSKYGIDIYNYKVRSTIKHNTILNIFSEIYINIYKPPYSLYNNQGSILQYDNIDDLAAACYEFIDICSFFNVAQGIYGFQRMTGIDDETLTRWELTAGAVDQDETSRRRYDVLKAVRKYNKNALINLLKDSPVGALAVANNDTETGLQWAKNQQAITTQNNVYYIPSERIDKLRIDKNPQE